MRTHRFFARAAAAALTLAAAGTASAHAGHSADAAPAAAGFFAGLAHPLGGPDHLLAMLAVGLWAALALPAGRRWLAPTLFVSLMALAALAVQGLAAPSMLEPALAASVVALGALVAFGKRLGAAAGLCVVAVAACLHGAAHGLEMTAGASALAFGAGFIASTAALHLVGLAAAPRLARWAGWAGALLSSAGLVMLFSSL